MTRVLPSEALTLDRIPGADAPDIEVIRFAQTLNGYAHVGGDAANLGTVMKALEQRPLEALSLDEVRVLLFARQRAHYHQGGGWGDHDPLMDAMRALTARIRRRVEARGPGIAVWRGDLTTLAVDAVVNAANRTLAGGGGVDGAIHRAAGPKLREACLAIPEVSPGVRCPTGEARLTPGFQLPADHVIHTVGPVWHGGDRGEAEALVSAYRSSLALAATEGLASLAFPSISTGAFGFPLRRAAPLAVGAIRSFLATAAHPVRVLLVAFDDATEDALTRALGA